jgi:hypothetical protein
MSESLYIYSLSPLTKQDVQALISEQGGVLDPGMGNIGLIHSPQLFDDEQLGGEPQGGIYIDVSYGRSRELAVAFVSACVRRWPCVVYAEGNILSKEEVLAIQQAGKYFMNYPR